MALLKDQDENNVAMKLIKIIKVIEWINKWASEIVDSDDALGLKPRRWQVTGRPGAFFGGQTPFSQITFRSSGLHRRL
jgi:hypothetical protein